MNWYKVFYWMSIADNVKAVFLTLAIISLIWCCIALITLAWNRDNNSSYNFGRWTARMNWTMMFVSLFSWGLWVFTPSKKDCMLIIAGGSVGNFITSDSSSKALPADLTRYLHLKLNAELEDLGSDTRKEMGLQTHKEEIIDKVKDYSKEQLIEYLKKDTTIK